MDDMVGMHMLGNFMETFYAGALLVSGGCWLTGTLRLVINKAVSVEQRTAVCHMRLQSLFKSDQPGSNVVEQAWDLTTQEAKAG